MIKIRSDREDITRWRYNLNEQDVRACWVQAKYNNKDMNRPAPPTWQHVNSTYGSTFCDHKHKMIYKRHVMTAEFERATFNIDRTQYKILDPVEPIMVFNDGVIEGKYEYGDQFDRFILNCAGNPDNSSQFIIPIFIQNSNNYTFCSEQVCHLELAPIPELVILTIKALNSTGNKLGVFHSYHFYNSNEYIVVYLVQPNGIVYLWTCYQGRPPEDLEGMGFTSPRVHIPTNNININNIQRKACRLLQ